MLVRRTKTRISAALVVMAVLGLAACERPSAPAEPGLEDDGSLPDARLAADGGAFRVAAIGAAAELDVSAERLALLAENEESQTLALRFVAMQPLFDAETGDRLGSDVLLHGDGIWGHLGTAVDVMISGAIKQESILILLDNFTIVQIIDGITFTPAGVEMPDPEDIIIHGPLWDVGLCGKATSFTEVFRHLADPDAGFAEPLLAVGTEGGCVGLAGLARLGDSIPNPDSWDGLPIIATLDPLVRVAESPIDDVVRLIEEDVWGNVGDVIPNPDAWVPVGDIFADDWHDDPADWLPTADVFPDPDAWEQVGALSAGRVYGVYPGVRRSGDLLGAPPYDTFVLDGPAGLAGLGAPRIPIDAPPAIGTFLPAVQAARMAGADGSADLLVASFGPGNAWGETTPLTVSSTTALPFAVSQVTLGSLWGISPDLQRVLYAPFYNPNTGDPSGPIVALGGLLGVEIGPKAYNLKSRGKFVTALIEAGDDDVLDIVTESLGLVVVETEGDPLPALRTTVEDEDGDGNQELVVKFDRQALHELLDPLGVGSDATLELTWEYSDGSDGTAHQVVRIVNG